MFIVREIFSPHSPRIIGGAPTAQMAIELFLPADLLALEEDPQNPGHWDAMSKDMRQFTVEPEKSMTNATLMLRQVEDVRD